jgi:hypothetical protein
LTVRPVVLFESQPVVVVPLMITVSFDPPPALSIGHFLSWDAVLALTEDECRRCAAEAESYEERGMAYRLLDREAERNAPKVVYCV